MTETRHDTGYDRLREDFRQQLQEAATREASGRRPRWHAATGALVLAGTAVGTLMLTGAGTGGRLDILAQAKAALSPAGHVVHLVTTSHMEMRGGSQAEIVGPEAEENAHRIAEQWSTSEPTRWRVATTVPIVTAHGTSTSTGSVQLSYSNGTEELYVQPLDTLTIRTGVSEDNSRTRMPDELGVEPVPRIRSMLEDGQLHDIGSGTVDGHTVQRLVGDEPQGANPPQPIEYDIDPETYAPVRFTIEEVGKILPGNSGTPTQIIDVNTYEELPLNETTASLLSIHTSGNPTISSHQAAEPEPITARSARHAAQRRPH
jgi:hypothetical protein